MHIAHCTVHSKVESRARPVFLNFNYVSRNGIQIKSTSSKYQAYNKTRTMIFWRGRISKQSFRTFPALPEFFRSCFGIWKETEGKKKLVDMLLQEMVLNENKIGSLTN
jgi:hypothetical protein